MCLGFVVGSTLTRISESGSLYIISQLLSGHILLGVPDSIRPLLWWMFERWLWQPKYSQYMGYISSQEAKWHPWLKSRDFSMVVGIIFRLDNSRSIKELGIQYHPLSETLADYYHCWAMYSTAVKHAVFK
ncbi:unnamed protein product [Clonostachys chloroleuca]|uniref:Uncharacterized protein n=1 Tax=Clonostachys chloroleuca TaxID=1926264 RepID=A0AA35M7I7_9HYPO|nr:unnamed protein product [Clonostachys chloroleuca]